MTTHLAVPGGARRSADRTAATIARYNCLMSVAFTLEPGPPGAPSGHEDRARVRDLRRLAVDRLHAAGLDPLGDDVALIVSELLTNVVVHSGTNAASLDMAVLGDVLHLAVTDGMPGGREPAGSADPEAESGRGLYLVDCVVRANGGTWGTKDVGRVWCELPLPAGEER